MKLLHTSDWHLGRNLYGHKRTDEFHQFLDWLAKTIIAENIDILCVAGDIFDTTTPNNTVQSLYFSFLHKLIDSGCRKIIITAGNHDSPSLLEAPKPLLGQMNIEVIGRAAPPEEELIIVTAESGAPAALICAAPFLRDQDIRTSSACESGDEKQQKLLDGILAHYRALGAAATAKLAELQVKVVVIGMGHLFAAGGKCQEGDGVRDLYVGNLVQVRASDIPPVFDYLALGHLHRPQRVAGKDHWRYSGSPLAMNFSESDLAREVVIVEFEETVTDIRSLPVPCFKKLVSVTGNFADISKQIEELCRTDEPIWLEIIHLGDTAPDLLNEKLHSLIAGSQLSLVRIVNKRLVDCILRPMEEQENLQTLSVDEVFRRCLAEHEFAAELVDELNIRFQTAVTEAEQEEPEPVDERSDS